MAIVKRNLYVQRRSVGIFRTPVAEEAYMQRYLGFYWTLPVPWAGFTQLPADADEAAAQSRTIRYQRDRVRQWVAQEKGDLIGETVFMETAPDRGNKHILPEVEKLLRRCRDEDARLVLVDFSTAFGWRSHQALWSYLRTMPERVEPLDAIPVAIGGEIFDPVAHFRQWQEANADWSEKKSERRAIAARRIPELAAEGRSNREIAEALNTEGISTVTGGRPWTKESVRKFGESL